MHQFIQYKKVAICRRCKAEAAERVGDESVDYFIVSTYPVEFGARMLYCVVEYSGAQTFKQLRVVFAAKCET